MTLTDKDKTALREMGFPPEDFRQIQEVASGKFTSYTLYESEEDEKGKRISRDEAIRLLGRRTWLSGLGRSAFHYTAVRKIEGSEALIYFNSRKYFADW